jgi:CTP synthase (UTP-ammonia lyase)
MRKRVSIGLVGDYDKSVPAHQAIPLALQRAAESLHVELSFEWVPTEEIRAASRILSFDGLWCVPASPYRSMNGALLAIRHARECRVPFLGTCGGFQHAVIEYARNVMGWADAEHAETSPNAAHAVISLLECSLVETSGVVRFFPGSRIAAAYGVSEATEGYRCRYGLNPEFRSALLAGPLRASAEDEDGEVRAIELDGHPFFVATLFQPERASLAGRSPPLVFALVSACAA